VFATANEKYATDYPASVGQHMTNTDSAPFQDLVAAISLRENERGAQIGNGWDPTGTNRPTCTRRSATRTSAWASNAAQTTLAAVAQLTGATLRR